MSKVGIIGFGKMGQIREKVVEESGKGKVLKVYDPSDINDPRMVNEPYDIINDPELDSVFICTPNNFNFEFTVAALKQGKNVFCEKPPVLTVSQMKKVIEVEKQSGKHLMYGFNHRHHCSIKKMKEMVDSKEYGKILWMRGRYGKSVDESYKDNWRSDPELAGGGILMDQGIHMVDLFLYLSEGFDQYHAFVSNLYWDFPSEDNVFAIMKNSETGLCASLHSTMTQWRHLFSIEVFLERGYFVLNGLKTSSNSYGDEVLTIAKNRSTAPAATWEDEERFTYHIDKSWLSEVNHFFDSIKNGKPVEIGNSVEALQLMETLDHIYSSDPSYKRNS